MSHQGCSSLRVFVLLAQARLRDRHQELLKRKLLFLKQQQLSSGDRDAEDPPLFPAGAETGDGGGEGTGEVVKVKEEGEEGTTAGPSGTGEEQDTLIDEDDLLRRAYEDYETGGYSPKLLKFTDVEEVCEYQYTPSQSSKLHPPPHPPGSNCRC